MSLSQKKKNLLLVSQEKCKQMPFLQALLASSWYDHGGHSHALWNVPELAQTAYY
jgi:hypothetical protein